MATTALRNDEATRIRTAIEGWAGALRAKDAERVLSWHGPGFVHYSMAPPLKQAGSDREELEGWFATWKGPLGYEVHDLELTVGDGVAFCHSLNRLSGTKIEGTKPDGFKVALWFRVTLGLRKIGTAWKIVHEHESVPFYMDGSLKAAVDLEP
jgi:PhnB protein